jgi:hypothetical protein
MTSQAHYDGIFLNLPESWDGMMGWVYFSMGVFT